MIAIVASTPAERAALEKLIARINARLGYPKDGTPIGGGVHAPAAQARTLSCAKIHEHPDKGRWCVVVEKTWLRVEVSFEKLAIADKKSGGRANADDLAIDALPASVLLTDDWTPKDPRSAKDAAVGDAKAPRSALKKI